MKRTVFPIMLSPCLKLYAYETDINILFWVWHVDMFIISYMYFFPGYLTPKREKKKRKKKKDDLPM